MMTAPLPIQHPRPITIGRVSTVGASVTRSPRPSPYWLVTTTCGPRCVPSPTRTPPSPSTMAPAAITTQSPNDTSAPLREP